LDTEEFDVVAIEKAEKSIDAFIDSRSKARLKANKEEEREKARERSRKKREREQNLRRWIDYHERLSLKHASIASDHADRRQRLLQEASYSPDGDPDPEAA